ncbi:MAG: hypothetical protein M3H12_05620 [Chromatiales bacterium]
MDVERRDSVKQSELMVQPCEVREEAMITAKPFIISKHRVYEAYRLVKANAGSAGVDKQSIAAFEEDLKDNLYKLWNRMSSGSYMPRLFGRCLFRRSLVESEYWVCQRSVTE